MTHWLLLLAVIVGLVFDVEAVSKMHHHHGKHHNKRSHSHPLNTLLTEVKTHTRTQVGAVCFSAPSNIDVIDGDCATVASISSGSSVELRPNEQTTSESTEGTPTPDCDLPCADGICMYRIVHEGQNAWVMTDGIEESSFTSCAGSSEGGMSVDNGSSSEDSVNEEEGTSAETPNSNPALHIGQEEPSVAVVARPLVSGDGLCWKTANLPVAIKESPCSGSTLVTAQPRTVLTPLYESQTVTTSCRQGPQWHKVRYNDQDGWVPHTYVIKHHCVDTECPFEPIQPKTCYRTKTGAKIRSEACAGTEETIQQNAIVTASEDDSVTSPVTASSCSTGNGGTEWIAVVWRKGTELTPTPGYVSSRFLTSFECNGDGWFSSVGALPVERLDRTNTVHRDTSVRKAHSTGAQDQPLGKFLLHVTDGAWPRYGTYESGTRTLDGKGAWPHFILGRDDQGVIRLGQYYSIYNTGWATESVGRTGAVQIEIGSKADPAITDEDAALSEAVRLLWHALHEYTGMPLCVDSRVNFVHLVAYGGPSERSPHRGGQRLPVATIRQVNGLIGHQHVQGATHWCPGQIDPFMLAQDVPITASAVAQPTETD